MLSALQRENELLRAENLLLKERLGQLERLVFGARRERFKADQDPHQAKLFEDAGEATTEAVKTEVVVKKHIKTFSRKGIKRNRFPAHLERKTQVIHPEQSVEGLTRIGEDITELLAYRPARLYVKQLIRPRLADKQDEEKGVVQAPIPPRIVPKGMVDESLIAQLIVEKIQFHTPVYRFVKKLKQAGIDFIKQNNLHNWFHTGAHSLVPLYHLLVKDILAQGYIQGDETPITVLAKNKVGASHRGYMWAFHAPTIRAVAFNYEPSRSTEAAKVILDRFCGTLQVDGYSAYENIGKRKDIELIYCMAHARRKFYEAKDTDPHRCQYFLKKVQQLYQIEAQAREQSLNSERRLLLRQDKALSILKELENWLTSQHADKTILPRSLLRKAIDYALSRWKGLMAYAHNGILEIDNNLIENTIRPIALGRKNYLFAGSHDAAQNLAVLYSIVGTCEKNKINAYQYLHWALQKVAHEKVTSKALDWLPHRIQPQILEEFAMQ